MATRYFICDDLATAQTLSHAKLEAQPGYNAETSTSQYWWTWFEHPTLPIVALKIGPDGSAYDASSLTVQQQAALIDYAGAMALGFDFPDPDGN